MPIIQPQSPQAQRAMLQYQGQPVVHRDGSLSRAAPSVQAALRQDRIALRNRQILAVAGLLTTGLACFMVGIYFFDHVAHASERTSIDMPLNELPDAIPVAKELVFVEAPETAMDPRDTLDLAKTPQEFVDRAKINGVRMSGSQTRVIINGTLYQVGDVVASEMGLVLIGHDPDGEYLLFRDANQRTVFLPVRTPSEPG